MTNKAPIVHDNSAARLRSLLDKAGDAFVLHDIYGKILDVNQTLCDNLGYSRQELLTMSIYDIELTAKKENESFWKTLLAQKQSVLVEGRHRRKDGTTYPTEVKLTSCDERDGDFIIAFARDITQRHLAEKWLRLTQFAVDHAADATFWFKSDSARVIYANKQACQYLGYSLDELLTLSVPDINPKFPIDGWARFVDEIMNSRRMVWQALHKTKLGEFIPVEVIANHVNFENTEYIVTFVRDISQRKKYERQIIVEKQNAENANRAKSEFLSSMNHELRTPLNAVIGFSELLRLATNPPLTEEQHSFAESINKAGHHLLSLVEEVLDLSRIEAGHVELHPRPFFLNSVFEECVDMVIPLAQKNDLTITAFGEDTNQVQVYADYKKCKQIIINLLSNAIKYNRPSGRIDLRFTIEGQFVRISVTDTGLGIPKSEAHQLFTAFKRLGREKSGIEGTGIGLVVCKQLAELMGGSMGYESTEGAGSTFWVSLPLAPPAPI